MRGSWKHRDDLQPLLLPSKEKPEASGIGLQGTAWQCLNGFDLSWESPLRQAGDVFHNASRLFILESIQSVFRGSRNANIAWQMGQRFAESLNGCVGGGGALFVQSDEPRRPSGW